MKNKKITGSVFAWAIFNIKLDIRTIQEKKQHLKTITYCFQR